jgi:sugar/nucleoside kinase (ribokinase family)
MIAARVDLLVIGALTVDRFADGSSAPGGSVLHVARAGAPRGARVSVITVAGPEAEAQAGLDELRRLAIAVEATSADATATFTHREEAGRRTLGLGRRGGRLRVSGSRLLSGMAAVLLAPVAGEIAADDLAPLDPTARRVAILQGWLRSLDEGTEVRPIRLGALASPLREALARFDLLVASREDLAAESDDPAQQLDALRRAVGPGPALVVTDGADGAWLDAPGSGQAGARHLRVPWRVGSASTVGAGDILAAFLAIGSVEPAGSLAAHTESAMRTVAEILEERRA